MASNKILASVVVPTYKEVANIRPLVERLMAEVNKRKNSSINKNNIEILFVDDNSRDGSEEEVKKLASEGYPVSIIVRTTERGLSSAVLRGFQDAKGSILLCMDADLQVSLFQYIMPAKPSFGT
jgi:dolichol-phosphate mannosyltransferase